MDNNLGRIYLNFLLDSKSTKEIDEFLDKFSDLEKIAVLIVSNEEKIRMSDLASKLNKPNSSVNYIVNNMVKKGYFHKNKLDTDKRTTMVQLTQEGKEFAARIDDNMNSRISKIIDSFDEVAKQKLTFNEYMKLKELVEKII